MGTVIGVIIAVALVLIAAEFALRIFIGRSVADSYVESRGNAAATADASPSVSFGTSPVLPALITNDLKNVELDTPDTLQVSNADGAAATPEIAGDPAAHIVLSDVDISNRNDPVAQEVVVETELSPELIQAIANRRAGGIARISQLTPNPAEGTLKAEISSGFADVDFRPTVNNGGLGLDVEGASVLGFGVDPVAGPIGDALLAGISERFSPEFDLVSATVTETGLQLTLRGNGVALSSLEGLRFQ